MVRSVAREFHWPPKTIGGLFIDDQDYNGLEFWYNDINTANAELIKKKPNG